MYNYRFFKLWELQQNTLYYIKKVGIIYIEMFLLKNFEQFSSKIEKKKNKGKKTTILILKWSPT